MLVLKILDINSFTNKEQHKVIEMDILFYVMDFIASFKCLCIGYFDITLSQTRLAALIIGAP